MRHDLDGPICASVDHRYWTYFVVWCPHFQQYTVRAQQYLETGTGDDPTNLATREVQLGPFDDKLAVLDYLRKWVLEDWDTAAD